MARIEFKNDRTRSLEEAEGSDGRMNVSSRADNRGYYNSRDEGQCFAAMFHFNNVATDEFAVAMKNTHTTKTLVIQTVQLGATAVMSVGLDFVTGTAAGGLAVDPVNLNKESNNDATGDFMMGMNAATGITGLTADGHIDMTYLQAYGTSEFKIGNQIRLGQGDSIAVHIVSVVAVDAQLGGAFFFYYE